MQKKTIHGFHAVNSRLRRLPDSVLEIYISAGRQDPRMRELVELAEQQKRKVVAVDAERLAATPREMRSSLPTLLVITEADRSVTTLLLPSDY